MLSVRRPWRLGSRVSVCPLGVLCCGCGGLGHWAPVHRCARLVCSVFRLLGHLAPVDGVPGQCVVLRVRYRWPLGFRSPVCPLRVLCVRRPWRLDSPSQLCPLVVLCVRCPWLVGSRSPVCPLSVLCCMCSVLAHLAGIHRCARSVCCDACAFSLPIWHPFAGVPAWCVVRFFFLATWLLISGVPSQCVVLCVQCPWPRGSRSPLCTLRVLCCLGSVLAHLGCRSPMCTSGVLRCLCSVLGHLPPVHRVPAWCVVLRVQSLWPLGSRSLVCTLGVLCCVCRVLGHLARVHRCACSVCCVACAVSLATRLPSPGVPSWCVVLRVQYPWPLGARSVMCMLGVLCCVCGVLSHLAPVDRCARSVCCVCGALGHLASVWRCARSMYCVACAVSLPTWLPFDGVPAWCVVLCVRYPWPLGSRSPVCTLGVLCCVCSILAHLAAVHRCTR